MISPVDGSPPRPRVVCVVPAWNEATRIQAIVHAVPPNVCEATVVVDDGSTDDTAARALEAGAEVLVQPVNRGVGAAIRAGIDWARARQAHIVVVLSGSGKTPPAQIPRLLAALGDPRVMLAQGSRYARGGRQERMPMVRLIGTRGYSILFSALVRGWVTDASSGFRAIRLTIFDDPRVNLWQKWLDRYELEPYLLFQAIRLGHRVVEVPVTIMYPEASHPLGYTKMRAFVDWWKILRPVVFLAFGLRR